MKSVEEVLLRKNHFNSQFSEDKHAKIQKYLLTVDIKKYYLLIGLCAVKNFSTRLIVKHYRSCLYTGLLCICFLEHKSFHCDEQNCNNFTCFSVNELSHQ